MKYRNRFLAVWLSAAMAVTMSTPVMASETVETAVNGSSLETENPEEASQQEAASESTQVSETTDSSAGSTAEPSNETAADPAASEQSQEKSTSTSESATSTEESSAEQKTDTGAVSKDGTENVSDAANQDQAVTSVKLQYRKNGVLSQIPSNQTITLSADDKSVYSIGAEILPAEAAGQAKSYHSDAERVVSVDSNGTLTVKAAGTAHVWAEAGGVSSAKLTIVVKASESESAVESNSSESQNQPLLSITNGKTLKTSEENQNSSDESISLLTVGDALTVGENDAYSDEIGTTTEPDGEYDNAAFEKTSGGMHSSTGITSVNVKIKDGRAYATITYRSSVLATHFYIGYVKGAENTSVYNPETGEKAEYCYATEDAGTETIGSKTYHLSRATVPVPIGTSFDFSVRVPGVMSASSVWVTYQYKITVDESQRTPLTDDEKDPDTTTDTEDGTTKEWTVNNTPKVMFKATSASVSGTGSSKILTIILSGTGYQYLYKGSTEEASTSRQSSRIKYYEKDGGYAFDIPVSEQETTIDLASLSTKQQKWYSRKLTLDWAQKTVTVGNGDGATLADTPMAGVTFAAADSSGNKLGSAAVTVTGSDGAAVSAEADGSFTLKDGAKYTITVTSDGYQPQTFAYTVSGDANVPVTLAVDKASADQWNVVNNFNMFKVISALVTGSGSNRTLLITLNGTGYKYLYKGSTSLAATSKKSSRIRYSVNSDGKYEFSIPVSISESTISIAALSARESKWFGRTLTLDWNTKTITVDHSADQTLDDNPAQEENGGSTTGGSTTGGNTGSSQNQTDKQSDGQDTNSTAKGSTSGSASVSGYTFSWSGGSGRARITCLNVFEKNGQLYATIHFSQTSGGTSSYTTVRSLGQTISGSNTFTIPVNKNANTPIEALTTAMSSPHWISYTLYVGAKDGSSTGTSLTQNTTTFDEEAPEIQGLTAKGEVDVNYSDYVRIFSYDQGIYLIEINQVSDTARENADDSTKDTADDTDTEDAASEDAAADADTESTKSSGTTDDSTQGTDDAAQQGTSVVEESPAMDNSTADVYQQDIVKYLVVPEGIEVPAGLDKETVIIQQPVDHAYVASKEALDLLDQLGSCDAIRLLGIKADDVQIDSVKKRMETDYSGNDAVTYAGASDDWDLKTLLTKKADLAVLSADLLPEKTEDLDSFNKLYSKEVDEAIELEMPLLIDRSADEKNDLAKAEWLKVYGILFGNYDEGQKLYNQVVNKATEQQKKDAIASLRSNNDSE